MPIYTYQNKETSEIVDVVQSMNDVHEYNGENGDEKGLWQRLYYVPNMSMDTSFDPFDVNSFKKSTVNKNDSYNDLFSRSKEASEKRSAKLGFDPVKDQYYKDYAAQRNGTVHPDVQKKAIKEKLDKKGIDIQF
jgi:hypothetical protein